MIYVFRKEMKKWHTVLWFVVASMALSYVSVVLFRQKSASEVRLAKVNGSPIYFDAFRRSLIDVQARINSLRPLAQAYGMSEEMFLSTFLGATKPEELALDNCVKEKLIDQAKKNFHIVLDSTWFKNELIKSLPQMTGEDGKLNMDMYQRYLERISTTPAEYEHQRNQDFKRDIVQRFIHGTVYIPSFIAKDIFNADHTERSFSILRLPLESFIEMAKKESVDEKTLEQFYQDNKNLYRVGEKRKAKYWELSPAQYTKAVDIEPASVRAFYERHKGTMFRVAPKIKVRKILVKFSTPNAQKVAKDLHQQAIKKQADFATLATNSSQDEATAKNGGLVDFFSRGTYKDNDDFERAAFRLTTEGDISPVVKTKQGYEIIQLVGRIQASEKPFELVKDDIAKTLKAKRSTGVIQGDLTALMRAAREDDKAIDQFAQEHKLNMKETDWVAEDASKEPGITGLITKRLFSQQKQQNLAGYFLDQDLYVIYKLSDSEKSYIPLLKDVRAKVLSDYYKEKAEKLAKGALKDSRAAVLSKKATLQDLAEKYKATLITTQKVKKGGAMTELAGDGALREKLFTLTDMAQILEYAHKDVFYLAQLKTSEAVEGESFDKEHEKIIKQEKYKANSLHMGAFIASLHRNAKIEIDQKLLERPQVDLKD